jgi:hypothetical protein
MPRPEHEALVDRALEAFEPDPRVLALWLEGSVARGTDDAASDLDLHLAIADAAYEGFGTAPEVVGRLGRPLGYLGTALPGQRILPATIEGGKGPVRVDLYLEQRSRLATSPRMPDRRMLFDRDGVDADLSRAPAFAFNARAELENLMRGYWFGAMWPARFTLREDWGGMLMNATAVVYQFIVPAWLIADGSSEFYREAFARARFLSPERRAAIDTLMGHALEAFAGIEHGTPDRAQLARFHERFLETVWRAFREACATCGADYDAFAEQQYRDYYAREMGVLVPPLS